MKTYIPKPFARIRLDFYWIGVAKKGDEEEFLRKIDQHFSKTGRLLLLKPSSLLKVSQTTF